MSYTPRTTYPNRYEVHTPRAELLKRLSQFTKRMPIAQRQLCNREKRRFFNGVFQQSLTKRHLYRKKIVGERAISKNSFIYDFITRLIECSIRSRKRHRATCPGNRLSRDARPLFESERELVFYSIRFNSLKTTLTSRVSLNKVF